LAYIDEAEERFFKEKAGHSFTAKELYDSGYLEYLPIDFQQYDDYGVIYKFDNDIGNYDYIMGAY
jgi:hypothetical protein